MSTKSASSKKIPATVGMSSTKQTSRLVQTTMFSTTTAKPADQANVSGAYVDLTLSESDDDEIGDAIVEEPPLKKQNCSKVSVKPIIESQKHSVPSTMVPRISNKLTLDELREEALARNIDPWSIPKTKAELLNNLLFDGSIHLRETREYKQYMQILATMESERPWLMEQAAAIREVEEGKRRERQRKQQEKRSAQRIVKEKAAEELRQKQEAERIAARATEIEAQKCFHSHSYPLVHSHKLACTAKLKMNGKARNQVTCNYCRRQHFHLDYAFTCDECDFDICEDCFKERNITPEERAARQEKRRKEQMRLRKQQEMQEKELERQRRQRELESEAEWDTEKQFTAAIMKPPAKNKSFTSKGHDYVVWSADDELYGGESDQHFDSSWKTAQEANDRARYLFFWENPSGIEAREFGEGCDHGPIDKSFRQDLVTYTIEYHRYRWTVGVVPTAAFPHLKSPRFDNERELTVSDYYGIGY